MSGWIGSGLMTAALCLVTYWLGRRTSIPYAGTGARHYPKPSDEANVPRDTRSVGLRPWHIRCQTCTAAIDLAIPQGSARSGPELVAMIIERATADGWGIVRTDPVGYGICPACLGTWPQYVSLSGGNPR